MAKFYIVGRKSFKAYNSIQKTLKDEHKKFLTVSLDKIPVAKCEKGKWEYQAWIGSEDIAHIMKTHNIDNSVVATLYSVGKLSLSLIPDEGIFTVEEWVKRLETLPDSFCLIDDQYREFDIDSVIDDWKVFRKDPSLNLSVDEQRDLYKTVNSMSKNRIPYNYWTTVKYEIKPDRTLRHVDLVANPRTTYADDAWGMAEFSTLLFN